MGVGVGREQRRVTVKDARGNAKGHNPKPFDFCHECNRRRGFDGCDLGDAAGVAAAREARGQPGIDDGIGFALGKEPSAQAKHIGVVVETRQPGRLDSRRHHRADTAHLACGDGHALTCGADENALRPGMAVHGRFREPCPACGAPVQRIVYAANSTSRP